MAPEYPQTQSQTETETETEHPFVIADYTDRTTRIVVAYEALNLAYGLLFDLGYKGDIDWYTTSECVRDVATAAARLREIV